MLRRVFGFALVALLTTAIGVNAQESASSGITGQVFDSSKAGLPGATITVINTGTNAQRVTQSDAEGRFSVPNLPPATYLLKVELSGFQAAEVKDLTLRNGEIARPSVALGIANIAETVTVTGSSPLVQSTNASVSQTITQKQIEDLPVAGRNPLAFAALSAGVTPQSFPRHAVWRCRQQPQPVRHRRRGPRQLDQLRDRRRVRPVTQVQQPVADAAARRCAGSHGAAK